MRISDWSSDVCSSDLLSPTSLRRRGVDGRPPLPRSRPLATRQARPGRAEPPSRPPTTTERWACATPGSAALLRLRPGTQRPRAWGTALSRSRETSRGRETSRQPERTHRDRDRKSVGEGKSVAVREDIGGRRILKTKKNNK